MWLLKKTYLDGRIVAARQNDAFPKVDCADKVKMSPIATSPTDTSLHSGQSRWADARREERPLRHQDNLVSLSSKFSRNTIRIGLEVAVFRAIRWGTDHRVVHLQIL